MRNLSAMFAVLFVTLFCANSLFAQDKAAQIAALEVECADLQKWIDEKTTILAPKLEILQQEYKKVEPFFKEMIEAQDRLEKAAKEAGEAAVKSVAALQTMLDSGTEENRKALDEANAIFKEKTKAMEKVNEELTVLNKKVEPMVDRLMLLKKVIDDQQAVVDGVKDSLAKKQVALAALKSGK